MKVFIGLKASPLLIHRSALRRYKVVRAIAEARTAEIININRLHETLEILQNEVEGKSMEDRTRAMKRHNAKSNLILLNITMGDYVMIRTHVHRDYKRQYKWCGPMLVKQAKSSLVFIVEDLFNAK